MKILEALKKRRSVYQLGNNLAASDDEIVNLVTEITELVPEAFNMRSQRVIIALGEKHKALWNAIDDIFGGKVSRVKIDGSKKARGTILYFYDSSVIKEMQEKFQSYAPYFPLLANQANGMLQITIWTALLELNAGANIQYYNPVIDKAVRKIFGVPDEWVLLAQMVFGNIEEEPDTKEKKNISLMVRV